MTEIVPLKPVSASRAGFHLPIQRMAVLLTGLYVLLVYPVNHLYQYHSIIGNVPRFLDGVFGIITVAVTVVLLIVLIQHLARCKNDSIGVSIVAVFFGVTALMLGWTVMHYFLASGPQGGEEPFGYYARMIVSYLSLFLAGFYLHVTNFRRIWLLLFAAMCISLMLHINWGRMMIDLRGIIDPSYRGAYLDLSTTAMFSIFIVWAIVRNAMFRLLVLALGLVVLFFLGSRANLAGYLMALPVAIAFSISLQKQIGLYTSAGIAVVVALVGLGGMEWIMDSRHGQFFTLDQMTSLIARNQLFIEGMEGISSSPVYGHYAGQVLIEGRGLGAYIHNTLSVWQAFGLLPFLLFTGLLLWGVVFAGRTLFMKGRNASRHDQLLAVLATLIFVLSIAAKSVGWSHVAFVWGLLASHYMSGPRFIHRGST